MEYEDIITLIKSNQVTVRCASCSRIFQTTDQDSEHTLHGVLSFSTAVASLLGTVLGERTDVDTEQT